MIKNMLLCAMVKALKNKRTPEVLAGIFFIFGGIFIGASFLTRIEFISFFSSLSDDFEYLKDNAFMLEINSILWIVSAIFMSILSASLLVAMKVHNELLAYITTFLFLITSFIILVAGIKGLSVIEFLSYQENKVLNLAENEYLKANILNLTKERTSYTLIATIIAGTSLLFLGIFGVASKRIPFFPTFLCLTGGLVLPAASIFFPASILHEIGVVIFLLALVLVGFRLTFKGFTRKKIIEAD